jgi:signal recognition particle subunit SRP54
MDVNQLLNRFADAQKMLKQVGGMMPGGKRKATKSPKNKRKGRKGARPRTPGGGLPGGRPGAVPQLPPGMDPNAAPDAGFTPPRLDFGKLASRPDRDSTN